MISAIRTTVVEPLVCPIHDKIDDVDGVPNTPNENVLPVMAVPDESFSVTMNNDVGTAGAVTTKLKDAPPLVVASVATPDPDGPYVGAAKSPAIAIALPAASLTVTVHEISSLARTYVVRPVVCPIHDSVDAAVADVTLNANVLPVIGKDPLVSLSVIWNTAVITAGAVKKNVNVDPPLTVASVVTPPPDGP